MTSSQPSQSSDGQHTIADSGTMLPTVVESVFNAARTGNLAALKVSRCPTLRMLLFRVLSFLYSLFCCATNTPFTTRACTSVSCDRRQRRLKGRISALDKRKRRFRCMHTHSPTDGGLSVRKETKTKAIVCSACCAMCGLATAIVTHEGALPAVSSCSLVHACVCFGLSSRTVPRTRHHLSGWSGRPDGCQKQR